MKNQITTKADIMHHIQKEREQLALPGGSRGGINHYEKK